MKKEQEIMEMFDERFGYDGTVDGTGLHETLWSDNRLEYFDELKDFISQIITLVQKRKEEEIVERIDEIIAKTDDYKEKSGLYGARDIINLNKQNESKEEI